MPAKLTKDEFLSRCAEKHNGKYDYSLSEYINSTTKVVIVCPQHGKFEQRPADHMNGRGCRECYYESIPDRSRLDLDTFLQRAREVHGDKYDYSKSIYTTTDIPLVVICRIHGDFLVTPHNHIANKNGCKQCGVIRRSAARTRSPKEFIAEARKVHGDKYSYDKVVYRKSVERVIITCSFHGDFEQKPVSHLQGRGCPACGGSLLMSNDQFVEKAKQIHGDRFDYSKVQYLNSTTQVVIVCKEHGEFLQTPASHLQGSGCSACSGVKRHEQADFLRLAVAVHGTKYDYSRTRYKSAAGKVTIICPKHGSFTQRAGQHLVGRGCDKCGGTAKLTRDEFVEAANKKYGGKYDYTKVGDFKNSKDKVEIVCHVHGVFRQSPNCHLREESVGCPECGQLSSSDKRRLGRDKFIKRAIAKHGVKYSYDKVAYKHMHAKVTIICHKHGDFSQLAHTHLRGSGCPICQESSGERDVRQYLEAHHIAHVQEKYVKGLGRFDFIVKKGGSVGFIEFQGHQHYFPVDFGSKTKYARMKILIKNLARDHRKKAWCDQRGYDYLAIPYWDRGRVKEILDKFFAGEPVELGCPPIEVERYNKHREVILRRLEQDGLK